MKWDTGYRGRCFWPIDQTGNLDSLVTHESASWHDQPGFPVHVVGIDVILQEDVKTATKADRQFLSNQGP